MERDYLLPSDQKALQHTMKVIKETRQPPKPDIQTSKGSHIASHSPRPNR